jgi:hypothetical protein
MTIATREQIAEYKTIPTRITQAIEGLSESQKQYRPMEGEWNIHEIVVHLADSEAVGFWRLRKTLVERDSVLAVFDEDAWSKTLVYGQQDAQLALRLFTDLRTSSAELLKIIPEDAWERTSIHAERGQLSVYDYFLTYLGHGEAHLQQIERIKQALSA